MQGVLAGFATIAAVIGVGMLLAQLKIVNVSGQLLLSKISFFVASPALMLITLGGTDVSTLFSTNLVASIVSVIVTATLYVLAARLVWKRDVSDTVIGTFCASYVNAGNLGLPIAAYALGDASVIAPMLLTQLVLMQPIGLTILDWATNRDARPSGQSRRQQILRAVSQPFRNPLMIGSALGLLLSITDFQLPPIVYDPIAMLGGMAVPAMLIAYGVSLRLGPLPGQGEPLAQIGCIVFLKLMVQPTVAILFAKFALGLSGHALLAVAIVAALPTAQNIFTHANRYDRGIILARDSIFLTTVLSVPVVIALAAWLG